MRAPRNMRVLLSPTTKIHLFARHDQAALWSRSCAFHSQPHPALSLLLLLLLLLLTCCSIIIFLDSPPLIFCREHSSTTRLQSSSLSWNTSGVQTGLPPFPVNQRPLAHSHRHRWALRRSLPPKLLPVSQVALIHWYFFPAGPTCQAADEDQEGESGVSICPSAQICELSTMLSVSTVVVASRRPNAESTASTRCASSTAEASIPRRLV